MDEKIVESHMSKRWIVITLIVLSVIALAARIGADVHFKAWKSPSAMEHPSIARALINGKGFTFSDWNYYGPTSVQSPPFPFLVAGMFEIFHAVAADGNLIEANAEKSYMAILLLNAFAGAGLVWLTYAMTRTLGGTPLAGLIAALLVAVWPTQIYSARFVQAVAMITCGVAGMIILYYKATRTGNPRTWMGFCFLACVVTLIEPVFLPALLLSGVLMFASRNLDWNTRLRNLAILAFAGFAVLGPWATRNYIVHGKFIPVKGSFWVNVWKGNNDYATGSDRLRLTDAAKKRVAEEARSGESDDIQDTAHMREMLDPSQIAMLGNHPEAMREEIFKKIAIDWIVAHPVGTLAHPGYLVLCGIRLVKTLTYDWDNPRAYLSPTYKIIRLLLLVMTIPALVFAIKNKWSLVFPTVLILTALASYTLTVTAARFAFPFEPIQLALAGGLAAMLLPDPDRKKAGQPPRRGFEPLMTPRVGAAMSH
jgi:4-amino-4-deoxy-L-arabinose transferase-like glycosyltransferase